MKITIDTDVCKNKGEDVGVILYLLSLLSGSKITPNTFEQARQKGFLRFEQMYDPRKPFPDYVTLSQTGTYITESILANSQTSNAGDRYEELADKLRELFPAGKKPGYAYQWRDSTAGIAERLRKFTMKYGEYPDDKIIEATKRYVNSFNGNYTYMQLLKYFIWKNKTTGAELINGRIVGENERQSQLAAYLDNEEEEEVAVNQDWNVTLR